MDFLLHEASVQRGDAQRATSISWMELHSHVEDDRPFRVNSEAHPSFRRPGDEELLWRYSDMEKYVSMLATGALWFPRADTLGDPFEGSLTKENVRVRPDVYKDLPFDAMRNIERSRQLMRMHTYVSCWHRSSMESAAMWSLYADRAGIAVVSNYRRIRGAVGEIAASAKDMKSIYAGSVEYVSYDDFFIPEGNLFDAFMHKRHSYEHEHEVRLVMMDLPVRAQPAEEADSVADLLAPSPAGVRVPANLSDLIAEVRVSPTAPAWLYDAVVAVTRRFGLESPVRQSDLAGDPVY